MGRTSTTMKNLIALSFAAMLVLSGCFTYERRTTAVVDPAPATSVRTVTVLPSGYVTRTYRGVDYYSYNNVYYRTYPSGGYVVVPRPW